MRQFSISLGKILGIQTTIHWTFWILILWIVFTNASQGQGAGDILWYVLFVFAIFGCVVLHELGHAMAARNYGIGTQSITILPIGGVASLEKIPEDPKQELVVAFAGPLVNIIIAALLFLFLSVSGNLMMDPEALTRITPQNFLPLLFNVNILLVVFNLIPAFPMDGGRVLRALLAFRMNRLSATEWAVNVGKFFAIIFVFWGFFNNPFLIFIALFIFLSAQSELSHVKSETLLGGFTVADILMHDYTLLEASSPLSEAIDVLLNGQEKRFLITESQTIVGTLEKTDLIKGLTHLGESAPIAKAMQPNVNWLAPTTPLQEARELMLKSGISIMPVGENDILRGVLDLDNMNEFLLVRSAVES